MKTTRIRYFLLSAMTISAENCSNTTPPDMIPMNLDIQTRYNSDSNKLFVNGRHVSGKQINGTLTNGRQSNGRQVNGAFETNVSNNEIISLVFVDAGTGTTYKGPDLIGITVVGQLSDGSMREVRFAAHDANTVPGTNLYLVNYVDTGESLCGNRDGQPIWAAILPQQYDETTGSERARDQNKYTFSCRFGAIQRCQELWYLKNGTALETYNGTTRVRNLDDYHAACVRMIRADYCGDGRPHTFDNTTIDFYDHLTNGKIATTGTTGQDGFYFESDWDTDGAHCLNSTRWMPVSLSGIEMNRSTANPDWEYVRLNCPERFAFPVLTANGSASVPDRACGASSNWNTSVGFYLYSSNAATQTGRSKIRTNTMLNMYGLQ